MNTFLNPLQETNYTRKTAGTGPGRGGGERGAINQDTEMWVEKRPREEATSAEGGPGGLRKDGSPVLAEGKREEGREGGGKDCKAARITPAATNEITPVANIVLKCGACGSISNLMACSGCKLEVYCSTQCQTLKVHVPRV